MTETAIQPGMRHKIQRVAHKKVQKVIAALRRDLVYLNNTLGKLPITSKSLKEKEECMKNIPKEYWKYREIFQEELKTGLLQHSKWDHEIVLRDGTTTTFYKIYNLNEKQLQALREYLDEMLAKGYI